MKSVRNSDGVDCMQLGHKIRSTCTKLNLKKIFCKAKKKITLVSGNLPCVYRSPSRIVECVSDYIFLI